MLCDKTVFILRKVLTHAEVSTHHLMALSLQEHLQAAARYSPDDFIMLEVCNKSSGGWQLATLLPACRCCQLHGATPPTGTDSTPLAGDGLCLHYKSPSICTWKFVTGQCDKICEHSQWRPLSVWSSNILCVLTTNYFIFHGRRRYFKTVLFFLNIFTIKSAT